MRLVRPAAARVMDPVAEDLDVVTLLVHVERLVTGVGELAPGDLDVVPVQVHEATARDVRVPERESTEAPVGGAALRAQHVVVRDPEHRSCALRGPPRPCTARPLCTRASGRGPACMCRRGRGPSDPPEACSGPSARSATAPRRFRDSSPIPSSRRGRPCPSTVPAGREGWHRRRRAEAAVGAAVGLRWSRCAWPGWRRRCRRRRWRAPRRCASRWRGRSRRAGTCRSRRPRRRGGIRTSSRSRWS